MLEFDEERFVRIQSQAVSHAEALHDYIRRLLDDGVDRVVFAGAGGAGILMQPAVALLHAESSFPAVVEYPAELLLNGARHVGPSSLVVVPSLSGTTKEAVDVISLAQSRGAKVLSLTGSGSTPVAEAADLNLVVEAADDTSSEAFFLQSLLAALAVLDVRGEIDDYEAVVEEIRRLPNLLLEVKRQFEPRAAAMAEEIQDEDFHIFTSAGGSYAEAYYFGMCILEEMQWIRTRPVHAANFFHGSLELLEPGVSLFVLHGEDATRPLTERVETFAREHTDRLRVIDAAEFSMPGVSARTRSMVSPVVHATVLERLALHLSVLRDHPLTRRRYYRRMKY